MAVLELAVGEYRSRERDSTMEKPGLEGGFHVSET